MNAISDIVGSEGAFDGGLCVGGIGGDGNADIKEREVIVEGSVLVSLT